jgi:hypothetical protein
MEKQIGNQMCKVPFGTGLKEFTIRCLKNAEYKAPQDAPEIVHQHWNDSKDLSDFTARVLSDSRLKITQGYAELSKEVSGHWERVRRMLGDDRVFKTMSDVGAVRVVSKDHSVSMLIPNSHGDGITRCAIISKNDSNDFNRDMMKFSGISIEGEFEITNSDCGEITPVRSLNGTYFVYVYDGLVAFVETT